MSQYLGWRCSDRHVTINHLGMGMVMKSLAKAALAATVAASAVPASSAVMITGTIPAGETGFDRSVSNSTGRALTVNFRFSRVVQGEFEFGVRSDRRDFINGVEVGVLTIDFFQSTGPVIGKFFQFQIPVTDSYDERTRTGSLRFYDPKSATGFLYFTSSAPTDYQVSFINGGVPETATWAMMIIGFGAIGGAMRSRQASKRASAITFATASL